MVNPYWDKIKKTVSEIDDLVNNKSKESVESKRSTKIFFGKKCPKCDSRNVKTVKAGFMKHLMQQNVAIWVPGAKISKPLNVCRNCGFSWEDR
ncbi:MAG: hypothetical protein NTY75_04425 [Candidatus Shapirobacteria bacterium]|nr:hypothetical protein [Candidatus Shapirobacteria bacterium]